MKFLEEHASSRESWSLFPHGESDLRKKAHDLRIYCPVLPFWKSRSSYQKNVCALEELLGENQSGFSPRKEYRAMNFIHVIKKYEDEEMRAAYKTLVKKL
ncbi:MAG: hypothetical protein GY915_01535 [bacterium]|nr:hypothetical protein [bacterium]